MFSMVQSTSFSLFSNSLVEFSAPRAQIVAVAQDGPVVHSAILFIFCIPVLVPARLGWGVYGITSGC